MLLLIQIILIKIIVLLVNNLDKIIVKTNNFSYYLLIALFFSFSLNFVITIIINTFRILFINCIKIIKTINLLKISSNNSSCNCNNVLQLFYFLTNNFAS